MRKSSKYKIYAQCKKLLLDCPTKIIKFKRSKWNIFKLLANESLKRENFSDFSVLAPDDLEEVKLFYRTRLFIKRNMKQMYDSNFKLKTLKKAIFKKVNLHLNSNNFMTRVALKLEYRLDILLFRLSFFRSVHEARVNIKKGVVFVNEHRISPVYFLKKGDVISFNKSLDIETILNCSYKMESYNPFVEIDFYSLKIVIVKDLSELSFEDLSLFYIKHVNHSKLYNCLGGLV
jgi:ribosomal protein S4